MSEQIADSAESERSGLSGMQVFGIVVLTIAVTVGVTWWGIHYYLYTKEFKSVSLSNKEEVALEEKLDALGFDLNVSSKRDGVSASEFDKDGRLQPEKYNETNAKREIDFSERELNALLASNSELASKLAIDLSANLMSAKMLIPVDPDFPILGGKTIRGNAGVELAYKSGKPIVILKGVSLWGVPIPNAWLGGLKNIDLVSEFGADRGFWKAFADGVEDIRVEDGKLRIKLKE